MTTASVMNWHADMATAPAMDAYAITPSDTTNFATPFRAIYVGATGGNVTIVTPSGAAILFAGTVVGSILPVVGVRVNATGTAATSLVGLV